MAINLYNFRFLYVIAFLLLCVSVGSAETVGYFTEYDSNQWTYTEPTGSAAGGDYTNSWLYMRDISYHTDGLQFVSEVVPYSSFIGTLLPTHESYFEGITLTEKVSGTYVASGRMGYYNMSGENKVKIWLWVDVDTWNSSYVQTLSGPQYLIINGMTSAYYDTTNFRNSANVVWSGDDWECFFAGQAGALINYDHGFYNVQSQVYFNNEYHYSVSNNVHTVEVLKTVDSVVSPSLVTVNNSDGLTLASDGDYNVIDFYMQDNNLSIPYQLIVVAETTGTVHSVYLTAPDLDENTIEWGSLNYTVDDTGSYTWYLSDDNWDTWLYSKKASIYKDEILLHEVSLPSQTGTSYYTFDEEGNYVVKLRHTSILLPHVTIDIDVTTVSPIGESLITVVNNTIYTNSPIGFQFSYGFTPSTDYQTGIEAHKLIDGEWTRVNYWSLPGSIVGDMAANTLYSYTLGITGHHADSPLATDGSYIFHLVDAERGLAASSDVYQVVTKIGVVTDNITTTYLNITSGDTYLMGDSFVFNYGIDSTNYSTGSNYMEIYNYDYGITTQTALLTKQVDYEWGTIYPTGLYEPSESYYWGGMVGIPGENKLLIRHDDVNGSTELVYDNFTLAEISTTGYGLKLSKYEACINDPVIISVIIPSESNLTIWSPTNVVIKTFNLNKSTSITYHFPITGQYSFALYPSGSNGAEAVATILISDCIGDGDDGIVIPPGDGDMDNMYQNMFDFMTIPAFWGVIIILGFVGGLAKKTNRAGDRLVSGPALAFITFALINLFAIVGLFAPYTMYILVSTWIFAGMFFGVGKLLAKGE